MPAPCRRSRTPRAVRAPSAQRDPLLWNPHVFRFSRICFAAAWIADSKDVTDAWTAWCAKCQATDLPFFAMRVALQPRHTRAQARPDSTSDGETTRPAWARRVCAYVLVYRLHSKGLQAEPVVAFDSQQRHPAQRAIAAMSVKFRQPRLSPDGGVLAGLDGLASLEGLESTAGGETGDATGSGAVIWAVLGGDP